MWTTKDRDHLRFLFVYPWIFEIISFFFSLWHFQFALFCFCWFNYFVFLNFVPFFVCFSLFYCAACRFWNQRGLSTFPKDFLSCSWGHYREWFSSGTRCLHFLDVFVLEKGCAKIKISGIQQHDTNHFFTYGYTYWRRFLLAGFAVWGRGVKTEQWIVHVIDAQFLVFQHTSQSRCIFPQHVWRWRKFDMSFWVLVCSSPEVISLSRVSLWLSQHLFLLDFQHVIQYCFLLTGRKVLIHHVSGDLKSKRHRSRIPRISRQQSHCLPQPSD